MCAAINSSMLKKIKEFIIRRKTDDITPQEAEKIQKASYALSKAEIKKKFSPVYQSFLSGLDSQEVQVFEATVYYLAKIAKNKAKYRVEILEILKNKLKESNIKSENKDFIRRQIEDI